MSTAAVDQVSSYPQLDSGSRSAPSLKSDGSATALSQSCDAEQLLINSMRFIESPKKGMVPNHILDTSMSYLFLIHDKTYTYIDALRLKHLAFIGSWHPSVVVRTLTSINVVNRQWARLLLGLVTVHGQVNHLGM